MTRLLVSLDVMSDSLTLDELMRTFGFSESVSSFSKGVNALGRTRRRSLLRFESSAGDDAACDDHIATLMTDLYRIDACLATLGTTEVSVWLNIGLLFSTADGSVDFAAITLSNAKVPLRISVSAYPVAESCNDENGEKVEGL
jgi:hypothetical protein